LREDDFATDRGGRIITDAGEAPGYFLTTMPVYSDRPAAPGPTRSLRVGPGWVSCQPVILRLRAALNWPVMGRPKHFSSVTIGAPLEQVRADGQPIGFPGYGAGGSP
jgi:hypothetical protein